MKEDREGFLYPEADASRCIDCGEHDRACPILRVDGAFIDGKPFDQPQARGG
jgi:succinate dehydrogenase/fumarate reductase-like Fe-S protein